MKKKIRLALVGFFSWRYSGLFIFMGVTVGTLLWFRLGTLTPGFSESELAARASANSLRNILNNPLFLPHKILQYSLLKVGLQGAFAMRLVSTLFAGLILVAFYRILKTLYTMRIATMGTLLFASSGWFLHWARLATPNILYAGVIGLLWLGARLRTQNRRQVTIFYACLIGLCALYVPGFVWLVGLGLIWQHKAILNEFRRISPLYIAALVGGGVVGIAPLVYALSRHTALVTEWLGLAPGKIVLTTVGRNVLHIPVWLVYRTPEQPTYWLGRLPLLNVFEIVMLVLGAFALLSAIRLDRVKALVAALVLGVVIVGLNGFSSSIVLAPLYLIIAAGVALMLQQWFAVFPRNPFARSVGVVIISGLVALCCAYQLTSYFIAWPHNTVTKQTFRNQ
jgi:hypothetical protein